MKIKSVRETFFLPFFEFFHALKIAFTHTILQPFTDGQNFSRAYFRILSRMEILVSRGENSYFERFSRMSVFFSRIKKRFLINFHVWVFFSRIKKRSKCSHMGFFLHALKKGQEFT